MKSWRNFSATAGSIGAYAANQGFPSILNESSFILYHCWISIIVSEKKNCIQEGTDNPPEILACPEGGPTIELQNVKNSGSEAKL